MDILITFVPLLLALSVLAGIIVCVLLILKKGSGDKDRLIQQLMEKNRELEKKVDQLLEEVKRNQEEA